MTTGLGTAIAVQDAWAPTWTSGLFSTIVGAEAAWIGSWLPTAIDQTDPEGAERTAFHAGVAGALVLDHHVPQSGRSSAHTLFGSLVGNASGAGLSMLFSADEQLQTQVMLPMGAAGTLAGGLLGDRVELSSGDLSMMTVGTALAVAEASTIGFILNEQGTQKGDRQRAGLTLTAAGVGGAGLEALATQVEPELGDMLFLGTAAAWGATYGALTPAALQSDGSATDLARVTLVSADAFLLAGGLVVSPLIELSPRDTLLAQVAAVGGGTVGTIGVSLASDEGHHLATGALAGTTIGFIAGGIVQARRPKEHASLWRPPVPTAHARLPGQWQASVSPAVLADGSTGIAAKVDVHGW